MTVTGFCDDSGHLAADDPKALRPLYGREVEIRERRYGRSLDQNAYWHGAIVDVLAEDLGYEHDEMHYALLGEWRGYADGPFGHPQPRCVSSRTLTRKEFSDLIEFGIRFAANAGIVVQDAETWREPEDA